MKWLYLGLAITLLAAALRLGVPATPGARSARVNQSTLFNRLIGALFGVLLAGAAVYALKDTLPGFELEAERTWWGLIYAAIGVPVLYAMLSLRAPLWSYLLLLLAFIVPQFDPEFFTLFHSFMHVSFVYECFLHGVPPENPLMSGEPLRYMYGVHATIAWLMKFLPMSPPIAFAWLDAITMVAFALVCDRIARWFSAEPLFRVLSVTLALFGMDVFVDGPLQQILAHIIGIRRFGAPLSLMKFTGINTNQVGLVCMAMAVLGMVRIANRAPGRFASYALLFVATLAAAWLYQPAWMAIGAAAGACSIVALVLCRREFGRDALIVLALLAVATAIAAPVLMGVSQGGGVDKAPAISFWPGLFHYRVNGKYWLVHIITPGVLLWYARAQLLDAFRRLPQPVAVLALSVAVLHVLYVLVYLRFDNEYKLLGFASVALAPLCAIGLTRLYQQHRRIWVAALFLLMVPFMTDFTHVTHHVQLTDEVTTDGRRLHHQVADEDALYSWIWDETTTNSVFIDSLLTVPPIAGRHLFVGLDYNRSSRYDLGTLQNGWLIDANMFLTSIIAVDSEAHQLRKRLATELLAGQGAASDALVDELLAASPAGRPLYFIARNDPERQRLAATPRASVAYDHGGRTVFRLNNTKAN
jgi:hypothetical protein